jgi:hypothetical protein
MGILLPFALGIALNPTPIVAAILLLTSNRGMRKGIAYLVGWLIGLITLLTTVVLVVSSRDYRRASFTAQLTDWALLSFGVVLLIMAWIQWRKRPLPDEESLSLKWLRGMVQVNSFEAWSAGLFFGLFSVRNILLTGAAAMIMGESIMSTDGMLFSCLLFVTIASLGIALPVMLAATQSDQANATLTEWENWLSLHNLTINWIVRVVIAVQLLAISLTRLI